MIHKLAIAALALLGMFEWSTFTHQPVEIDVGTLVGDRITDVDEGAVQGVAIVEASPGWEYSVNDRASWQPASNLSLLLNTSAWLRHPMDSQARLTYRAWDQTEGMVGDGFTITATGGESAFSEASETVVFVRAAAVVDEDYRLPIKVTALSASNNPATLSDVTYTIEPPIATWQDRAAGDDPQIAGYVVPVSIGDCTLTVNGLDKHGVPVDPPGTLQISIVSGAARVIQVEALPQVPRDDDGGG